MIHSIQTKQTKGVVLKIDFEKAFDSVRWDFLYQVLDRMDFPKQWITWITGIFTSSRISVLVNGAPTAEFTPTRGLRQGDPLSPLLFNLVGEAFSRLVDKAKDLNILKGVTLPRCSSQITHLQFADDVVMFLDAQENSILGAKRVLQCFQVISGLKINFTKSCLCGYSQEGSRIASWAAMLGCSVGKGALAYLGALLGSSPSSLKFWEPLLRKIKAKIISIDASSISIAGRTVILQAVIDNLPSYWMNLFKIPEGVLKQVELIRRRFLWGYKQNSTRKLHLLAWNKICKPRSKGGLGIASMKLRNTAMLSRWWGKAYSQRNSGWNKLLSDRYGPSWNYDLASIDAKRCSPIVRGLINLKSNPIVAPILSSSNFKWSVMSGELVMFWEDWWISDKSLKAKFPDLYLCSSTRHMSVKNVLCVWNSDDAEASLWISNPTQDQLASIRVLRGLLENVILREGVDTMVWSIGNKEFSIKNAYQLMEHSMNPMMFCDNSQDKD